MSKYPIPSDAKSCETMKCTYYFMSHILLWFDQSYRYFAVNHSFSAQPYHALPFLLKHTISSCTFETVVSITNF